MADIPDMGKLAASVMAHEGLRLFPYTDTTGNLTIGYGRNLNGKGISTAEAAILLSDDLTDVRMEAESQAWWSVVQNDDVRARALLEILFNLGLVGLNGFVKALAYICTGDFADAANEFRSSEWATQVGQRAVILTAMIQTGQDFTT
jgi:lysozyme